jgi:hypothetical protein
MSKEMTSAKVKVIKDDKDKYSLKVQVDCGHTVNWSLIKITEANATTLKMIGVEFEDYTVKK